MDIPEVIQLEQSYNQPEISDIRRELSNKINQYNLCAKIKPGDKIAITAGSRGIKDMTTIIEQLIIEVRKCGGNPFIIPAMGSHGGGTAKGQRNILASLGITEEKLNAPIRATMRVVKI